MAAVQTTTATTMKRGTTSTIKICNINNQHVQDLQSRGKTTSECITIDNLAEAIRNAYFSDEENMHIFKHTNWFRHKHSSSEKQLA